MIHQYTYIAQLLHLERVEAGSFQLTDQVELLPWFGVGFLTQLHSVRPSSFRRDQGNVNKLLIRALAIDLLNRYIPLLEVPAIALWIFQSLPQATDATSAVATISLVVTMTETMLLLSSFDHVKNWNN